MVPDAEILTIAVQTLTKLGIQEFTIKVRCPAAPPAEFRNGAP